VAATDDTAYALTRDRRIVRTNEGWRRFASMNGGGGVIERWPVGSCIDDALPGPLRSFYVSAFRRTIESQERWEHEYDCSSLDVFRRFRMVVYPLEGEMLGVVHSPIVEHPHTWIEHSANGCDYAVNDVITRCAHCRRIRHPSDVRRWDWVPEYARSPPPNTSDGLCEPCAVFYYPLDA
jgi:hypothetical protein